MDPVSEDSKPIAAHKRPSAEPLEKVVVSLDVAVRVHFMAVEQRVRVISGEGPEELEPVASIDIVLAMDFQHARIAESICRHSDDILSGVLLSWDAK